MGEVWRAFDQKLGRPVAVKLLLDVFAADEVFRERFRAEARAAALIAHPNVVTVYDYGQEPCGGGGWLAYLVMEYVEGPTVAEKLSAEGRLSVAATLSGGAERRVGARPRRPSSRPTAPVIEISG
jgi:serine/threonine-protein kinase